MKNYKVVLLLVVSLLGYCSSAVCGQDAWILTIPPMLAGTNACPQIMESDTYEEYTTCPSGSQTVIWQGREWQRCDDDNRYTWEEATAYCRDLVLDGHCDWHLPGYEELKSLVVCSNGTSTPLENYPGHPYFCGDGNSASYVSPTIDDSFSCHPYYYWSSSSDNQAEAWALHFWVGGSSNMPDRTAELYVRCVRTGGTF